MIWIMAFKLKRLIWVNPNLPNREIKADESLFTRAKIESEFSYFTQEIINLFGSASTDLSNSFNVDRNIILFITLNKINKCNKLGIDLRLQVPNLNFQHYRLDFVCHSSSCYHEYKHKLFYLVYLDLVNYPLF